MKNQDKYYINVAPHLYQKLRTFRGNYPYTKTEINGTEWEYIDTKKGAETILFLTGASGTGEININNLIRYKDRFRIISPSYPPLGNFNALVEGIRTILEREGVGKVHLIGGSLGSGISHVFIRRYPEHVNKLVLMTFGLPDEILVKNLRKIIRTITLIPYAFFKKGTLKNIKKIYSGKTNDEIQFMSAFFQDLMDNQLNKRIIKGHFVMALDMAVNSESLSMYEPVKGQDKVLIIQAADDESFNEVQMKALVKAYPGAQHKMFESGGHVIPLSREDEINCIIEGFLNI